MSQRVDIVIVSPVHNEEESLAVFCERTATQLTSAGVTFEILMVDDGSQDGSWGVIEKLHQEDSRMRGIRLSRNFGKEAAILAGLEDARDASAVVVMDSDLQHPPSILPDMVSRWREGAEIVEAVKRTRTGQSWLGRIQARMFNRVFHGLTGLDLTDATDYRLLSRGALDALLTLPERAHFFRGTSTWIGYRRSRIYFDVDARVAGSSRFTFPALLRMAINSITSFTAAPLQIVTVGALAFASFAGILALQTIIKYTQGEAVTGFTTVILVLLIQGTLVLAGLGVIGQYLARIHDEVKNRPRYLVGESTPRRDVSS